jgi:hypothetical protein
MRELRRYDHEQMQLSRRGYVQNVDKESKYLKTQALVILENRIVLNGTRCPEKMLTFHNNAQHFRDFFRAAATRRGSVTEDRKS